MSDDIEQSYRHCARAARRAASNFYWSFWLLPKAKRRAMYALYAFSRRTDDLADSHGNGNRAAAIDDWRQALDRAFAGEATSLELPALVDAATRYKIPRQCFDDVIDGVTMDLTPRTFQTFEELSEYCHLVATAVGIACVHIWGFRDKGVFRPARCCGLAFQLTNILRDLKEDAQRGRVYLPLEDLQRFDYSADELLCGVVDRRLLELVRFEVDRADELYRCAEQTSDYLTRDGRRSFGVMLAVYRGLLEKIKRRGGDVFTRRIRLDSSRKAAAVMRQLLRRV